MASFGVGVPDTEEDIIRVGSGTSPHDLAAAVAHACYNGNPPVLRAIGAGAVNQAMKALAVARQFVAPRAIDLTVRPGFTTIKAPDRNNPGQQVDVSALLLKVIID